MIVGNKYEIILEVGGGEFGSPVKKIVFGRNKSIIRFECFLIVTDWKVDEIIEAQKNGEFEVGKFIPETKEIKVGGGGHDIESVMRIESILSGVYIEEFEEEAGEIAMLDGPIYDVSINLAHYNISVSWRDFCPDELSRINELVTLLWEWSNPIYADSEWR